MLAIASNGFNVYNYNLDNLIAFHHRIVPKLTFYKLAFQTRLHAYTRVFFLSVLFSHYHLEKGVVRLKTTLLTIAVQKSSQKTEVIDSDGKVLSSEILTAAGLVV